MQRLRQARGLAISVYILQNKYEHLTNLLEILKVIQVLYYAPL